MKRAFVILVGALVLLLLIGAGTVVFLGATEAGTRFLASQAERFVPVRFTDVSGALLREVRVGHLVYELDGQRLTIEGLTTSIQTMPLLFDNHLIVHSALADAVILTGSGEPAADAPPPELALPYMPLRIDAAEVVVERLELPGVFPMRVAGSASWLEDGLEIRTLNVVSEVIVGNVQGRIGTGSNPTIAAQANWSLPSREWGGEGRLDGRVDGFDLHHVLRGYVSVDAEGRGDLSNVSEPNVDVRVQSQDLEFGDTAIRGIAGRVSGTLSNFSAELESRVYGPGIEPFDLGVVAYGPVTGPLTLRNVSANALDGTQQAQGSVAWADDVQVRLGGTAGDVSLDGLREQLTGRVSAAFQLRYQEGLLGLGLSDISGTVNDRAVEGRVEVAQTGQGWLFDPVTLELGANRLNGSATLGGEMLELQAEVDARALEALALGIAGDAAGSVRLSGRWPDLDGRAALTSTRLEGFGVQVGEATLDAALNDGVLDATVAANRLEREQLVLEQTRLEAEGPLENLDWSLTWAGGSAAGALQRHDDGVEVRLARAETTLLDHQWSLREATRVRVLENRIDVAPVCITGAGASACVETFVFEAGRIETRGELDQAPVALLQPWLPIRLGDSGYLEGSWSLAGDLDDVSGDFTVAARRLTFVAAEEQDPVELPDLEADGDIADGALRLRLAATDQAFSVVGETRLAPVRADGSLSGSIRTSATDLAPLKVFDQRIETIGGTVQGNLDLSGTPAAPRLEGRFTLADGALELNNPDVALSDVAIRLRVDDSGRFVVRGEAMQGNDEVSFTADGSGLLGEALAFDATLTGEHLQGRHPDWEITVSPDLKLAYGSGRGRLTGRVEVPEAEIRLNTLPTSVPSPSEDVVVVGRGTGAGGNGDANRFRADVEVVLGEDVTLKAMGITAELEGDLRARLDAQGRTTLRGTLDVTGGVISTQGQTLTIESGTVVYNGPVTRPYVDVRAVRVIDDVTPEVTVGLHIRGDANNLTSSVFSEPAMSETRALSFLVLGRDIDQESADSDSSQLVAAAINLGLSRSKGITSELMRMTGLDELSASAETQDSFAIVAGKRVTDDLYVRYTYNTLSALGAFLVRYELTRSWQLEAQSGEQSAMDILYSIEK